MKNATKFIILFLLAAIGIGPAIAASKHNGSCIAFAGGRGKNKFAGAKCYLDTAPGDYKIRFKVMERDDPKAYRNFLSLVKKPRRCTITKRYKSSLADGMVNTRYKVSNC